MANNTTSTPQSTMQHPPQSTELTEFDPCVNAKPISPFYLYNHDSPRPSVDHKSKPSFNTSVQDLEAGSEDLTPTVTQEKLENQKKSTGRLGGLFSKRCQQMTKPKEKGWLARMPKKQRLITKLIIALFIIGCMIGIALGIAAGLKSGIWKSNNNQGEIH